MLPFQHQAKTVANSMGSGRVDSVTPHLHDHLYFMSTPGHGYLLADLRMIPSRVYKTLDDAHMMSGAIGVGEEDCKWALILVIAAHLYPEADWDAGYATKLGNAARVEYAVKTCLHWHPAEFTWILEGMRDSGDEGWENWSQCLAAVAEEVQTHA